MDKRNLSHEYIAEKAIQEYQKRVEEFDAQEEYLRSSKFPLGTIVVSDGLSSHLDNLFQVEEIGKIVGYDLDNNYYRVYYGENAPYIGRNENRLKLYTESENNIPEYITNKQPFDVMTLMLRL